MFKLNSFTSLLPDSKSPIRLLKGTVALLMLSLISVSSYANNTQPSNLISRAEAANPANFKFIRVNGSGVTDVMESCSIKKGLIACAIEKLELINGHSDEIDADYDLAQAFYYPSKAQPRTAVVVITRSGLMDDSVSAERYRISFKLENKQSNLTWNWVQYGEQFKCARGNKAGKWSKNLCP